MKKILLITFLFFLFVLPAISQEENGKEPEGSRIEALKIAYLTKKLNLSPEEAQRFWPVYNNYAAEIREVRIDQRRKNISELDTEEKILRIRKKYNAAFTAALNAEKVNTFFRSEKDFGNFVQKELAERRQMRKQLNQQRNNR